jgi:hypothetical protein
METIREYVDGLAEPLKSIAGSLRAAVEKGLPASHGGLTDGHPCWSNGDAAIATLVATDASVTVTLLATGESKSYSSMGEIEAEPLNLWLSAEDIR